MVSILVCRVTSSSKIPPVMKAAVSVESAAGEIMKAEEPLLRTPSKEPSLTDAAVPLEMAAAIEAPLSKGKIKSIKEDSWRSKESEIGSRNIIKGNRRGINVISSNRGLAKAPVVPAISFTIEL